MNIADLQNANNLVQLLSAVNAALSVLSGPNPSITIEVVSDNAGPVRVPLNVPVPALLTLLKNAQTSFQNQLAAAGITL